MPVDFDNLTIRTRKPFTPQRIQARVGTDCRIVRELREPYVYDEYVIVSAEATNDPYVAAIKVEPKRVWRF